MIMQEVEPKYPVQLTSLQLLLQIFALGHFYQRAVHVVMNHKTTQPAFIKDINTLCMYTDKNWTLDHKTNHESTFFKIGMHGFIKAE